MTNRLSRIKRRIALVTVVCMTFTLSMPIDAAAEEKSDVPNHWTKDTIQSWAGDDSIQYAETPYAPVAPAVTRNDETNTVSGMTTAMEYKLDSASWIPYVADVFNNLVFEGNNNLLVRFAAAGDVPTSAITSLKFTDKVIGGSNNGNGTAIKIATAAYNAVIASVTLSALYTPASWAGYQEVLTANAITKKSTAVQIAAATAAIQAAQTALVTVESAATVAVATAEASNLQTDVAAAQILVTALPAGAVQTALQSRIDAVQAIINIAEAALQAAAEIAVAAYEVAPITTLAEVTAAEALKAGADTAVIVVGDAAAKASFEARVIARATAIAAARTTLEAALTATATLDVVAFEAAPISNVVNPANILNLANAYKLKAIAISSVALVVDAAAKASLTARISARDVPMALADINLAQTNYQIGPLIPKNAAILGLDLTEYWKLSNQNYVKLGMIPILFTDPVQMKTVFDSLVATQRTTESSILTAFNNAPDEAAVQALITTYATNPNNTLYWNVVEYNNLPPAEKFNVNTALLAPNFLTGEELKTTFAISVINNSIGSSINSFYAVALGLEDPATYIGFQTLPTRSTIDAAVFAARPITDKAQLVVIALGSTIDPVYLGSLLKINSTLLGLDLTDYNALAPANKTAAQNAMMAATFTNATEVNAALAEAVANSVSITQQ